jgi:hypothetical protein
MIRSATFASRLLLALGVGVAIYSPWALRNWRVYRTFFPEQLSAVSKTWPSMAYGAASAAHNLIKSFWSVSGIANDVGYPFAAIGIAFMLLSLIGLCLYWKRIEQPLRIVNYPQFPILSALIIAVVINIILVLRFGYETGMGTDRFAKSANVVPAKTSLMRRCASPKP